MTCTSTWLLTAVLALAGLVASCSSSSAVATGPTPVKCQLSLGGSPVVAGGGGVGTIAVTAQPECGWTASTAVSWITDLAPRSGQGPAELQFRVAPNPRAVARAGDVIVNDERVSVSQEPAACSFEVRPPGWQIDAAGGQRQVEVTTLDGCEWTVSSQAPWITIVSDNRDSGSGRVVFDVAPNTGAVRTGSLAVAGQTVAVTQAAIVCHYAIAPEAHDAPALGGSGPAVTVSTSAGCAWEADSTVPWLVITSGDSGTASGVLTFSVLPNPGGVRTGTLVIAGLTFTVTQAALLCTYAVEPGSYAATPGGGPLPPITVTAPAGCAWEADSGDPWITITSGNSGNGSGLVEFSLSANPGLSRVGTLTVAGHTVTVTQAGLLD